ncbi:MAG: Ig-like domain-containing protein [Saprospiraceae bacterium]
MKNISKPKLIRVLVCLCMILSSLTGFAQNYQNHVVMMNEDFEYDFASFPWPNQPSDPSHGETEWEYMGILNGIWQNRITYTPNTDFVGLDSFYVCYNFTPDNTFGCMYFEMEVVDYSVVAVDDYVTANTGDIVSINVLENDISSSDVFNIQIATLANNGSLNVDSDSTITFIPNSGFRGAAQFHYTICDDEDKCDKAMVTVFYDNTESISEDVELAVKKNGYLDLIIPMEENFGFQSLPFSGNAVVHDENGVVRYEPYIGFTGTDDFTCYYEFEGVTKIVNYTINVLNVAEQNTFAANDFAITAADQSVTFNVLDNDANNTYVQSNTDPVNGTVTRSLGNITYTPNPGFEGAESFEYTVCLLGTPSCETATVYVTTSNYNPGNAEFTLQTAKNTPLVIDYNPEIEDWQFTGPGIIDGESDEGGTLEFFYGNSTHTINGQDVEGYNLLIYTPPSDEFDLTDEFEIWYCAPGGDCQTVKIYVDLIDAPLDANTDELCVTDCVFPGDANNDGIVNMVDVLPVGFCTGVVGPSRDNPSPDWYGQFSEDWDGPMGAIEKHVDTNGDGEITGADTLAINEHYGKTAAIVAGPVATLENIPLYFIPRTPNPGPGDLVQIDVMLGTPAAPAFDIYGLSFSLGYNAEIVEEGTMSIQFDDSSWASYNSPMLGFSKDRYAANKFDVAYTRTSDVSANGYGIIATVEFVIDDVIDLRLNEYITFRLDFEGEPITTNAAGQYVTVAGADMEMKINTKPGLNDTDDIIVAYPNPTDEVLNVFANGSEELEQVKIYDLIGNLLYDSGRILEKNHQVDVSTIHNGLYIVNAYTTKEMISVKAQIEHK